MAKLKILILLLACSVCFAQENPYRVLNSWNAGELSDLISAREDLSKYQAGCSVMENFFPLPQGAAQKRPGTKYIAEVKDSNHPARLLPFEYSEEQAYALEFGNEYIRFFYDKAPVLVGTGTEDLSSLDNIVAHWLMGDNEASTTVTDDEENFDGTASDNTSDMHAAGVVGDALDFGGDQLVTISDDDSFSFDDSGDEPFSIAGWFFITDTGEIQTLVSKWEDGVAQEYKLWMDADLKLNMTLSEAVADLSGDCVSQWKLNDNAATTVVVDTIGLQNGVATTNTENLTTAGATANTGTAFDLDNTYYVTVDDNDAYSFGDGTDDSAFSIAAWVYVVNTAGFNTIIGKYDTTTSSEAREWWFHITSGEVIGLRLYDESQNSYRSRVADDALATGWHFVVCTYNGDESNPVDGINLYVDGAVVDSTAYTSYPAGTYTAMENLATVVSIGAAKYTDGTYQYVWNDKLDVISLFDKELSSGEVLALYAGGEGTENLTLGDTAYTQTDDAVSTGWHFLAATYDNANASWSAATAASYINFYVDGDEVDATAHNNSAYSKMSNTAADVVIGAQTDSSDDGQYYWADKIDNLAVFSDLLSASEVASLYTIAPYEVETPYSYSDVNGLRYTQSADVIILVHPDYAPRKLSRYAHTWWELETIDFADGPFFDENTDSEFTITTPSATSDITDGAYAISSTDQAGETDDEAFNDVYTSGDGWGTDDIDTDSWIGQQFPTAHAITKIRVYPCYNTSAPATNPKHVWVEASNDGVTYTQIPIIKWRGPCEGYEIDKALVDETKNISKYVDFYLDNDDAYIYWRLWCDDNYGGARIFVLEMEMYEASSTTYTANKNLWNELHIDSLWKISQKLDQSAVTGSFDDAIGIMSDSIKVKGDWSFTTSGTWTGVVKLQRSYDDGGTWDDYRSFSSQVSADGTETLDNVRMRVYLDTYGSGTIKYHLGVVNPYVDGVIKITDVVSPTSVKGEIKTSLADDAEGASTWHWAEGAWSDLRGHPKTVCFNEDRLTFGGNAYKPQTIWASQTGDYYNMLAGPEDDQALKYTLSSNKINNIQWLVSKDKLLIGTIGSEWTVSGGNDEPLTPSNVQAKLQSSYGSADIQALLVNESVLFAQKNAKKLRELAYNWELDSYVSPDMTILNPEVTGDGINEMAYQQTPYSIVWCARDDGQLCAFSYERKQEITSWSRFITDGDFESVAVIPGSAEDELWAEVKRTINGSDVRYIEVFDSWEFDDANDAYFVDCGATYNNTNELTGLSWLEGEDVFVLADGAPLMVDDVNYYSVSGGTVTLDDTYGTIQAGLPYTAQIETMRLSWLGEISIQGRIKRIYEAIARYYNSGDFYVGRDAADKELVSVDGMASDEYPVPFPLGFDRIGKCLIYQYSPEPFTLIALMLSFEVE